MLVCLAAATTNTTAAHAAEPFDPAGAPPLLPGGEPLGTITDIIGVTSGHAGTGACAGDAAPRGYAHAAVYRVVIVERAVLDVTVADDLDNGTSVCRLSLYRHLAARPFADPFDTRQRAGAEVSYDEACATSSSCGLTATLIPDATYYVAVWSAASLPEATNHEAHFRYSASVRRFAPITASLAGARIRDCRTWHEIVVGDAYTVSFALAATGTVRIYLEVFASGAWRSYRYLDVPITGGRVWSSYRASGSGMWRFTAAFLGNDTTMPTPGRSASVNVRYVTPRWLRLTDGGVLLLTPRYKQQRNLSCEASSYRTAHNYFRPGHLTYDTQVYDKTGWDRRRPNVAGGCNPDRAFCGNVDGLMMRDGYGVHVDPMARAARIFDGCRPGIVLRNYSWATLASHVNDGFPVVVWGAHAGRTGLYRRAWRAWDGHYVVGYSVEHTWTVIGFRGGPSNPVSFIVVDPTNGRTMTVSVAYLNNFVKYFRTALVVRG